VFINFPPESVAYAKQLRLMKDSEADMIAQKEKGTFYGLDLKFYRYCTA
jgi:hypothetical protein